VRNGKNCSGFHAKATHPGVNFEMDCGLLAHLSRSSLHNVHVFKRADGELHVGLER
jgi:hypothetical protein